MNLFIDSVYNEDDPEVTADIERLMSISNDMHSKVEVSVSEAGLFKSSVDPALVAELIEKYTEGVVSGWQPGTSIDDTMRSVNGCLVMLKANFYK